MFNGAVSLLILLKNICYKRKKYIIDNIYFFYKKLIIFLKIKNKIISTINNYLIPLNPKALA